MSNDDDLEKELADVNDDELLDDIPDDILLNENLDDPLLSEAAILLGIEKPKIKG